MGKSCSSTSRALDEQLPNLLLFLVNRGMVKRYMPIAKKMEIHRSDLFCCEMSEPCILYLGLLFKAG